MLKSNMKDTNAWVEQDDVFVVDKGFRDSIIKAIE